MLFELLCPTWTAINLNLGACSVVYFLNPQSYELCLEFASNLSPIDHIRLDTWPRNILKKQINTAIDK